ncbi:hypothetical protein BT96DRAFT_960939 [Gymnopus androsaceus JB14]|uniref:DDE-1 domain-containing protein n=1 Tax=Gymnopus androsaceus JB14 TaxID=1447944 RepID=A0A6A4GFH1_9AGAR|nr:hypothetical protein BT96DRAFT_960939 [Gymnopus androsaceus JB14]
MRATTHAAQKLPVNVTEILTESYLREAWVIQNYSTVYQQGTKMTWDKTGNKQVAGVGKEEKRVFTLVPSISASGELLPFQAIYQGMTDQSCPSKKAAGYDEAKNTYWSTLETMKTLVGKIIAPYFERMKCTLGIEKPDKQMSIWKIDCWSVHKSEAFLTWMKKSHPTIIVLFVPGNSCAQAEHEMFSSP